VGPAPAGSVPPGLDPKVVQDYADALVPPPVAFAASDLRKEAAAAGAFEGVPAADAEDLHALLEALVEAKHAAHGSPGTSVGGPAGPEYRPSREELRLAEIVDRLRAAMTAAPAEEVRAAWKSAGLGDGPTQVQTFWTVTVKVFGTGYVTVVEPRTETLAPP
jgi:hypothetical protein